MRAKPVDSFWRRFVFLKVWLFAMAGPVLAFAGDRAVEFVGPQHANRPITLFLHGPESSETASPNPFTDFRVNVRFTKDDLQIAVPAYFCATKDAAETGAESGSLWQAHFVPPQAGTWAYEINFRSGAGIAMNRKAGKAAGCNGANGTLEVRPAKDNTDSWAEGKLQVTRRGRLRYAVSGRYYLKGGADSPENFLAYHEFDGTFKNPKANEKKLKNPLHRYEPHIKDWSQGDPTWQGSKGKGIVGALNYLASKGMNSVYFLTMNVTGDGDDVWPWVSPDVHDRFDCSKLAQWNRIFDHMDNLGIALHVITQETENDQLLDGGRLGSMRRLYYRELIARFAHHQAVVWNIGEECTNSTEQILSFADYIKKIDPYDNPIVVHTYPQQKEQVYAPLLGYPSIDGLSLQFNGNDWHTIGEHVGGWIRRSEQAGNRWMVCVDEPGSAERGLDPDSRQNNNHAKARQTALWEALFAGGSGVEWYFGYKNPHNDLNCEDWRSRDQFWEQTKHALDFFQDQSLVENSIRNDARIVSGKAYCLESGQGNFALYLPEGGNVSIDLEGLSGDFAASWHNPRTGEVVASSQQKVAAGARVDLGVPPTDPESDWAVSLRKTEKSATTKGSPTILVEAEDFERQRLSTVRSWRRTDGYHTPSIGKDADPPHVPQASGGAYLELLPDTRQTHGDELVKGISFSSEPGKVAVLDYPIYFAEPGRYYVWVRAYSTGSEDNGLHVGLDGKWPESGRRMQWCQGKNSWKWESRQRTAENHCGEPGKIFLDVKDIGLHNVSFSMREDGFEFDCFLLTPERDFAPPKQ